MSDETKRIILARRARFVAAALASVAATATAIGASTEACGGSTTDSEQSPDGGNPQPCLTVARDAEPQPCLSPQEPDAGGDGGRDGGRDGGGDGGKDAGKDAEPQPCLIAPLDGG